MNNQAAQTMPDLPPSFARVHNDGYWTLRVRDTAEFIVHDSRQTPAQEVYSSGQMRAMYQQGYAAALAQTAGVVDAIKKLPRFGLKYHKGLGANTITSEYFGPYLIREDVLRVLSAAPAASGGDPPSAASVSERARELRERAEAHGGGVFVSIGDIRALEQALTQQRGAVLDRPARVGGCLRHPYTGELRDYRDVESDPDGTLCVGPGPLAATTPQPSADAVREDDNG